MQELCSKFQDIKYKFQVPSSRFQDIKYKFQVPGSRIVLILELGTWNLEPVLILLEPVLYYLIFRL